MKKLLLALILSGSAMSLYAQDSLYSKVYYDGSWAIESKYNSISLNEGVVMTGRYQFNNAYFTELDSLGNTIWYTVLDYTSNQNSAEMDYILRTADSSYIASGKVYTDSRNRWDAALIKLNMSGDTLWTRYYGLASQPNCNGTSLIALADSSIFLSWTLDNDPRIFINHIDRNGVLLTSSVLTGTDNMKIDNVCTSGDTVMYLGLQNTSNMKATLLKVDINGQAIWGMDNDQTTMIDLGMAGSSVAMLSLNYPTGNLNITKMDPSGVALWQQEYIQQSEGWTDWETPSMTVLSDSSFILSNPDNSGSIVLKMDQLGTPVYGAYVEMVTLNAVETTNKGLYLVGNGPIYGIKSFTEHLGLIRVDSTLHGVNCLSTYTEPTPFAHFYTGNTLSYSGSFGVNEYPTAVTVDIGYMSITPGCVEFIGGIQEENTDAIKVYPTVSEGTFHFECQTGKTFELIIFDQLGNVVYRSKEMNGQGSVQLSCGSGMYLYKIHEDNELLQSGKLIINR